MHSSPVERKTTPLEQTTTHEVGEVLERGDVDVAAGFLATMDTSITADPIAPIESRKVLWKIDLIVLPVIAGTVILSAVDKVIISNAAILGMLKETNLSGNEFSWVGSIFYFGFLVFEWPTAVLIQKLPVAKLLAGLVFLWAVQLCCCAAPLPLTTLLASRGSDSLWAVQKPERFQLPASSPSCGIRKQSSQSASLSGTTR